MSTNDLDNVKPGDRVAILTRGEAHDRAIIKCTVDWIDKGLLRRAWRWAIEAETRACETLARACVDGVNTPEMLDDCRKASEERSIAFEAWVQALKSCHETERQQQKKEIG